MAVDRQKKMTTWAIPLLVLETGNICGNHDGVHGRAERFVRRKDHNFLYHI
jgi:hypothetical protein